MSDGDDEPGGRSVRRPATVWSVVAVAGALLLGGAWWARTQALANGPARTGGGTAAVPVEVAPIEHRAFEVERQFTGTLEAAASFVVAPKVGGRIERIAVDLADRVQRGQVVAELDDEELRHAVAQARAQVSVARARKAAAGKAVEIAQRNFDRVDGLAGRGITSAQEVDELRVRKLEAEAAVEVADAELTRAQASLREAQSRQGYARVTADWPKGADTRVVAARHADEGTTIAANEPILTIVDLAAVVVVVYATEEDYALLQADQRVALTTDAFPDEVFEGRVDRIAPVFAERSRQARVELRVPNEDGRLKPGMFVRAATSMSEVAAATVIPADALIEREGRPVVFVVSPDGATVRLHEVTVRARSGGFVAIDGEPIEGRVVTLGQQMLHDGAPIVIPNGTPTDETAP